MNGDGTHRQGGGQSRQSRRSEPLGFRDLDLLFSAAESQIDLLRRCQPDHGPEARSRWLAAYERGESADFSWQHGPAPDLGRLKRALDDAGRALLGRGQLGALYGERAEELRLEAELAECVGTPAFFALARRRYPRPNGPEARAALRLAADWARESPEAGPSQRSDDRRAPDSLVNLLHRELGRRRLPIRVQIVKSLGARAASGDGVIFIRAGTLLGVRAAWRITQHEILGHALPRVRAHAQLVGLCRVGSARSSDDEEGRALCIEERLDLLDAERRSELGRRHLAACAVADGASTVDCVRLLIECGSTVADAASLYARVARGGGLCRELVYLPAWLRLRSALSTDPTLERWLEHGRLSLDAAKALCEQGLMPIVAAQSNVATTGT